MRILDTIDLVLSHGLFVRNAEESIGGAVREERTAIDLMPGLGKSSFILNKEYKNIPTSSRRNKAKCIMNILEIEMKERSLVPPARKKLQRFSVMVERVFFFSQSFNEYMERPETDVYWRIRILHSLMGFMASFNSTYITVQNSKKKFGDRQGREKVKFEIFQTLIDNISDWGLMCDNVMRLSEETEMVLFNTANTLSDYKSSDHFRIRVFCAVRGIIVGKVTFLREKESKTKRAFQNCNKMTIE